MSLDYPYYEELCRCKHRAAWWLIGDRIYYLGLLPAVMAAAGVLLSLPIGLVGFGWRRLLLSAIVFVVGTVMFFVGVLLKGHT